MTEPKTFRVQLDDDPKVGVAEGRYKTEDVAGGEFTWIRVPYRFPREARELDITIAPVKSLKQQRREARDQALKLSKSSVLHDCWVVRDMALDAIEQADAEFDREREMELDRLRSEVEVLRAWVGGLEGAGAHEWTKHDRDGWTVCSRCGMVRNYDRETPCRGKTPPIAPRTERRELRELAEELHETSYALAEQSVRYRHRRTGKVYVLTSVSLRESDLVMLVSYVPTECRGVTFTRPLVEFQEKFEAESFEKHGMKR